MNRQRKSVAEITLWAATYILLAVALAVGVGNILELDGAMTEQAALASSLDAVQARLDAPAHCPPARTYVSAAERCFGYDNTKRTA